MKIVDVCLVTHCLASQHDFYARVLGFPVLSAHHDTLTLGVGDARLTFARREQEGEGERDGERDGSYHVAFTIPTNQFAEAKAWLVQRVPLITDAAGTDVFFFSKWNAHALYFADPAGNVMELIARHTLPNATDRPFDALNILTISEIGLATENVQETTEVLRATLGVTPHHIQGSETFTALGDDHGLLIVVDQKRDWFPETGKTAGPMPVTATVAQGSGHTYRISVPPCPCAIEALPTCSAVGA
jgi:catechol-2,3-dioxygenase